ncbi:hypothetical protein [Williamsia serinedens]|uniref:Uncharacterized protein n=1 Tax=Williamsia serinedens TaxID=391736 RepID=A0ABT1H758_9NOCA|nr:hypothetical protein [Williamsia serinedens]MCP2163084.1 hypothetical protein [Williamsia serinedens]
MAIDRKTVTKPAEQHPFAAMTGDGGVSPAPTPPAGAGDQVEATRESQPGKRARRAPSLPARRSKANEHDPLISRTYRYPDSMDERMLRGALKLSMLRGTQVTKTDVLREAVDEYLKNHDLDD